MVDAAHNDPDIASPKKEEKREVVGEELFPGQIGGEEEGLAMTLHWIVCWLWRRRRMGFGNGGGGGESFGAETEVPDSFQKSILAADAVPSPPFSPHLWLILFRFGFFTLPVIAVRRRRRLLHGDGRETLLCIAQMKANERLTDAFFLLRKKI